MGLVQTELYKILRKRYLWGFMAGAAFILVVWLAGCVAETDTVAEDLRYTGLAAIQKDREIAEQWEGTLTMEKLYAILDTYGLAVNEGADWETPRGGNWVSRYATDQLTDFLSREDHSAAEFREEDSLWRLEKNLSTYQPYFCYMDQADFLYEALMAVNVVVMLLIILGLSPVFTEEHQQKTAPLLLTCIKGKKELVRAKLIASFLFAEGLFLLADGIVFGSYLLIYGTDAMKAGASLISWFDAPGYAGCSVGQAFLISFFWTFLGFLVMTVTTLLISAAAQNSLWALGAALIFYGSGYCVSALLRIFPFFIVRVLLMIYRDYCPSTLITKVASNGILTGWQQLLLIAAGIFMSLFAMQKKWRQL